MDRMPNDACPINESVQEVDENSWVIGYRILLTRQRFPSSKYTWNDGKGFFYVFSEAPCPLPASRPLAATTHIEMIYDAGGASAVWSIGDAFCKVKILDPDATREHVTLDYLYKRRPLSFAIPDVHYHAENDGRYYIILGRLADQTLTEAWLIIDETMKQHYVSRIADICKELAVWQGDGIGGVDGKHLSDHFLTQLQLSVDCSPRSLLNSCKEVEMDWSTIIFYHCDLGPGNIIVEAVEGSIGIIDWETAGFVPKEWVRINFCISSGMDLPGSDQGSRVDWRRRLQR
ncbi:hypothetical protein SS1G_02915 [Sclerotinia sclerotiorum 1980 UF-70]|uniref:Aminoglycoside phosphotransferase domain-containing protein n=2 Tax=Sclerotinia sclerotiorum (strain ATCC 18683 / 1980 / Ss-1) TaxID=665079 RepID=A7EC77_SCLS1|nr:hypothetical protein SS1G_02915 [Sclerotinia sclerotiorum 1980 UF-70]APA09042.1 hypothetical protein sscle_04g038120 [Sclerotinia sclerotiorum 1980 UF-70]EDO00056.1 hypothetical protein SS1G_02915 [Sclerotinia sclerotiorum 1980 UF-70]